MRLTPIPTSLASSRRGFSLIELLVVIAISSILFTSLAVFTRSSLTATKAVQNQNVTAQTARTALSRLLQEAALAKTVTIAQPTHIAFITTDITGDGIDDTVDYTWTSTNNTLTRTLNGTAETFAQNISAFSLEYQYETEQTTVIASSGDTLQMTLGQFSGVSGAGYTTTQEQVDLVSGTVATQYFNNLAEVPAATSVTIRAGTAYLFPPADLSISLTDGTSTLATGTISRYALHTYWQNITTPLTWLDSSAKMSPGKSYCLVITANHATRYGGSIQCQRITVGPALTNGLEFSYTGHPYGNMASLYFTVYGSLPVTTPTHSTTSASVLKTVKASLTAIEGGEQFQLSRTCKVLNQ